MSNTLNFVRSAFISPADAAPAVEAVEATETSPAVEAVPATEARAGGWHVNHNLSHNGNSWSGMLWLEGLPEAASDDEIRAAILSLYGIKKL
jgi:hypothetical protein